MKPTATRTALAAVLSGLLAGGCLLKTETHTWYLEPGTAEITWVVSEGDVRSDAAAPADRHNEELTWWNAVQAANHPTARALRRLGAPDVEVRVLRSRVPFHIITEGSFRSIDDLGRQILMASGLAGTSALVREDDRVVWTLSARDPHVATEPEPDEDLTGLISGLGTLRVVLTDGRFVSATGFALEQDRRVAVFAEPDDGSEIVTLQLIWTATAGTR